MVKVNGLGVIKVGYISETCFCVSPFITPKAPSVLIVKVIANNIPLIQALFVLFKKIPPL